MNQILTRRGVLGGLIATLASPAIVRVASIMPVKAVELDGFLRLIGEMGDVNAMIWLVSWDGDDVYRVGLSDEQIYRTGPELDVFA